MVAGAGMGQAARGTAQQGIQIDAPEAERTSEHLERRPEDQRDQQGADGNEDQGMGELAVVFQNQQRVGVGADQRVGIRQQRGKEAHHRGGTSFTFPAARLGEGSAQQAVGQDVHLAAQRKQAVQRRGERSCISKESGSGE